MKPLVNYTFMMIGQSNGRGMNSTHSTFLPANVNPRLSHPAWIYNTDGTWNLLNDPTHGGPAVDSLLSGDAKGSYWPLLAKKLIPILGSIAFIPCCKSASSIGAWLYGDPNSRAYLYGISKCRGIEAGPVDLILMHQGEADAKINIVTGLPYTTEQQYVDRFNTLSTRYQNDLGCPVLPCKLQKCYSVQYNIPVINGAIQKVWDEIPNARRGADLSNIWAGNGSFPGSGDAVHLITPEASEAAAEAWVEPILSALGIV